VEEGGKGDRERDNAGLRDSNDPYDNEDLYVDREVINSFWLSHDILKKYLVDFERQTEERITEVEPIETTHAFIGDQRGNHLYDEHDKVLSEDADYLLILFVV
jgi:hypothetical protein